MPRIRTIKPECFLHRKVGRLSDRQFRLWVGLIGHADDEGRLVADTGQLRALIWGLRPDVTDDIVETELQAVARTRLIQLYTVDADRYVALPSWRHHQKIDRPSPSKLPAPPESGDGALLDDSASARRGLVEDSTRARQGSEGSEGSEVSTTLSGSARPHVSPPGEAPPGSIQDQEAAGEAGGGAGAPAAREAGPNGFHAQAREVLEHLNHQAGRNYRPVSANLDMIVARLKTKASVEDCKRVIDAKVAEWAGDPKMRKFLRPETLFGRVKFESYIGALGTAQTNGPAPTSAGMSPMMARAAAVLREQTAKREGAR